METNNRNTLSLVLNIAGELLLLLFLGKIVRLSVSDLELVWFQNGLAALTIFGSVVIMLLITGLFPDFLRSFVSSLKQKEGITAVQIKRSLLSVKLTMITAIVSWLFLSAVSFVPFMAELSTFEGDLGAYLTLIFADQSAGFLYSIVVVLILLPIHTRLKVRLISM